MLVAVYASFLAIWVVILSTRVIALRGNPAFKWFSFGNNNEEGLQRAIRAQGNLTEYLPIFLIIMLLAETNGLQANFLHYYGSAFLIGRLIHGISFGFMKEMLFLRVLGTVLTLLPLLGLSIYVFINCFS